MLQMSWLGNDLSATSSKAPARITQEEEMSSGEWSFCSQTLLRGALLECPEISEISSVFSWWWWWGLTWLSSAMGCAKGVVTASRKCSLFSEITQKNGLGQMVVIFSCVGHYVIDFREVFYWRLCKTQILWGLSKHSRTSKVGQNSLISVTFGDLSPRGSCAAA